MKVLHHFHHHNHHYHRHQLHWMLSFLFHIWTIILYYCIVARVILIFCPLHSSFSCLPTDWIACSSTRCCQQGKKKIKIKGICRLHCVLPIYWCSRKTRWASIQCQPSRQLRTVAVVCNSQSSSKPTIHCHSLFSPFHFDKFPTTSTKTETMSATSGQYQTVCLTTLEYAVKGALVSTHCPSCGLRLVIQNDSFGNLQQLFPLS